MMSFLEMNVSVSLLLEMNKSAKQSPSDLLLSLKGEVSRDIELRSWSQLLNEISPRLCAGHILNC